jgi:hypothetical protein
MQKSVEN